MTDDEKSGFQEDFWRRAGHNMRTALAMIDTIPGACFYVKDAKGRFVAANRRNCEICHVKDERSIVGLTSADVFPAPLARSYMELDRKVRERGMPVVSTTDSPTGDYSTDRLVKSVYPVWAGAECIGTMCVFVQTPAQQRVPAWHGRIRELTAWIARNPGEKMSLRELARRAGMEPRALRSAFAAILGTSVSSFVATQRLAAARRLLETTDKSLSEIAQECGFYDHSHLSKAFSAKWGVPPGAYRAKAGGRPAGRSGKTRAR